MTVRVAIVGQGYVGRELGLSAKKVGHEVIGIEIDEARVEALNNSVPYFVCSDYSRVVDFEIVVIAVPTPLSPERKPDLSFIRAACNSLRGVLSSGTLVINESTSYPGTLRNVIAPILGDEILYASAPERVDPGNKDWIIENTPRLVSGLDQEASLKVEEFYRSMCSSVIRVSSPEVAEAAKLFENSFRQVNIALVNEFSQIAHALGISTYETLLAASTKPFGFMRFLPSIGVGGHCIPVDPLYLSFAAEKVGVKSSFINLANEINESMPNHIATRIAQMFGGDLSSKLIQIVGISYKADVSDVRESPAIKLMTKLRQMGAIVLWHDDLVGEWNNEYSSVIQSVDLGIIATFHQEVNLELWRESNTLVIDVSMDPNTDWSKFL